MDTQIPAKKLSKRRHLTRARKLKILEAVMDGQSPKHAAIAAGYSPKSAQSQASQILKASNAEDGFAAILAESGITGRSLSARISALLDAEQSHFFNVNGEIQERKSPAHESRRKTVEMSLKLLGHLKPDASMPTIVNNSGLMQIVISKLSQNP